MVVDDQPAVCDVVADTVRYAGHEVVGTARNGAEAVALAREHRPEVVLMDISMPELNGVEAMRAMLADGTVQRVVLMSGEFRSLGLRKEDLYAAGATAFFEKPFNVADLFAQLDRLAAELRVT
jgi:CheY-like chemotaxis protein